MMSKQSAKDVKPNVWISNVKRKKKKKTDGRQIRKCSLYTSGHSKRFTDKNNQTHNIHLLQSLEMHSCQPFCFLTSET